VSFTTGAMACFFIPAAILSDRLGRRPVILGSLVASALFTLTSVLIPDWHTLLAMRALTGIALAGVPSVAMAYVSDEVEGPSVGAAMGLYIAGSAVGGMAGRLGVSVVADFFGWRAALGLLGLCGLLAAALFWRWAPAARGFTPRKHSLRSFAASTLRLLRHRTLPLLYLEGFLLMGAFVTIYNYVGFRLQAPPYSLSQATVGTIFLVYLVGSVSSAWFGALAGRRGSARVFWMPIGGLIAGIVLSLAMPLALVALGIIVVTGAFFGAHSIASGWVSRCAPEDRAQASSLYLLFYYLGSSLLGSAGGVAWSAHGWPGVVVFTGGLTFLGLLAALWLARGAAGGVGQAVRADVVPRH
jgi:YNFM family putative membrane transporter